MGKPLIMVSSITYAMKARDLLINNGIAAYIERTPKIERNGGCGYSLYVPKRIDEAENLLRTHGIKIVGRTDWEAVSYTHLTLPTNPRV